MSGFTLEKLMAAKKILEDNSREIGPYLSFCMQCGASFESPALAYLHVAKVHYPGKFISMEEFLERKPVDKVK